MFFPYQVSNVSVDRLHRGYRSEFNSIRTFAGMNGMYDYIGTPQQNMALSRYGRLGFF